MSAADLEASAGRRARDLGLGALGALFFGLTIVFNRALARDGLGAPTALGVRYGIAGVLLLCVLRARRRPLLPPSGERLRAALLGFALYAAESTFFFMALERGTAAAAALLFYTYPAVVAVTEAALGRIRLRGLTLLALALGVSGGAVVAVGGGRVAITTAGVWFMVGSVAMYSIYVLVSDTLTRTDPLTAAAWSALGASAGVFLIGIAFGNLHLPGPGAMAALGANGVATAAAFTLFFLVLGRLGPSRTAIVMALEAVTGIVLSAVFLGEAVHLAVAVGGASVLAGAVIAAAVVPPSIEQVESAAAP